MINNKARQHILSTLIIILLIVSVLSSIFGFPVSRVSAVDSPSVQTNNATGVEEMNATLQGYLVNDGGEDCAVWFEYGTTTSYGSANRYFWIVNFTNAEIYKYELDGTYTTEHFDTAVSGNVNPYGITTNGTFIWTVDTVDADVYQYYINGTYTNNNWSTVSATPRGITTDGNYIWIVDSGTDEVYKHDMDGTYTTEHWDTAVSGNANPNGITADDNYIWVTDIDDDEVYIRRCLRWPKLEWLR